MITDPDESDRLDIAVSARPALIIGVDVARSASDAAVIFPAVDGQQQDPSATQSRNLR